MKRVLLNSLVTLGIVFLFTACSSTVNQKGSLTDYASEKINPFLNGSEQKVDIYVESLKNISISRTNEKVSSFIEMNNSTLAISQKDLTILTVNFMKQFYTPKSVSSAYQVKNGFLVSIIKADANIIVSDNSSLTERVFTKLKIKVHRIKNSVVVQEKIIEIPLDENIGNKFRKVEWAWNISNDASFNMLPTNEKIKQMTALSMYFALDKLELNKK